jgi:hypothetical protein
MGEDINDMVVMGMLNIMTTMISINNSHEKLEDAGDDDDNKNDGDDFEEQKVNASDHMMMGQKLNMMAMMIFLLFS